MVPELLIALPVALAVVTVPGYFWARALATTADGLELLAYSAALSIALVPSAAILAARILGSGVTTIIAIMSVALVFATGVAAYLWIGPAGQDPPLARPPLPMGVYTLVGLFAAFGIVLATFLDAAAEIRYVGPVAALVTLAAFASPLGVRDEGVVRQPPEKPASPVWIGVTLVVLAIVLLRGYLGPVRHDWPFVRGGDQYSHAVMSNLMITEGRIDSYLIYPPGFHTMTAIVSRLSGLEPLELFPVLAPALTVLPALGCYALACRLWGQVYGVAAALLSGMLLLGPFESLAEARYPNIFSANFLIVMAIAALVGLYGSSGARHGALVAILGSSVVLYHQVGSLYLALLLMVVAVVFVPYLLLKGRSKAGISLLLTLAGIFVLSVLYAWETYDLPRLLAGALGGSNTGAGGTAVAIAIGSQEPLDLAHLLATTSQPVAWLALLGAALAASEVARGRVEAPQTLAYLTLLIWALLLFAGSRTEFSGFPQRFERDLGLPLAVLSALALVTILRSPARRALAAPRVTRLAAALTAILALGLVGLQAAANLEKAGRGSANVISEDVSRAGTWLGEHNTGGNIIVTPYLNDHVPGSAMLAMGGYTGLRSYTQERLRTPRALPPSGKGSLLAASWVTRHPDGERTEATIVRYDVRYLVFYKRYPGVPWRAFASGMRDYEKEFENGAMIILSPRVGASG